MTGFGPLCAVVFWRWADTDVEGTRLEINVSRSSTFHFISCWIRYCKWFWWFRYVLERRLGVATLHLHDFRRQLLILPINLNKDTRLCNSNFSALINFFSYPRVLEHVIYILQKIKNKILWWFYCGVLNCGFSHIYVDLNRDFYFFWSPNVFYSIASLHVLFIVFHESRIYSLIIYLRI